VGVGTGVDDCSAPGRLDAGAEDGTESRPGADRLPVLGAGKFELRGFEHRDVSMVCEAAADPEIPLVATVLAGSTEAQASAFVERQRHRLRDGFGYSFVIAEAGTDRGVGSIGLWLHDVDQGRATVGYWVVATARGHGAAHHALTALSAWALRDIGIPRIQLHVEPWNVPSIRTAERTGFVCEGLLRSWQVVGDTRRDMYVYSLLATDLP
jgi:RimJ/RimL family protein N-acetyltransferase